MPGNTLKALLIAFLKNSNVIYANNNITFVKIDLH